MHEAYLLALKQFSRRCPDWLPMCCRLHTEPCLVWSMLAKSEQHGSHAVREAELCLG